MFHLWSLAEQDLLSPDVSYRLRDTGQGLNRVQAAPKTNWMMHAILHRAQTDIGSWVGSSAIHMGDHNVPNALMFIGKYFKLWFLPSIRGQYDHKYIRCMYKYSVNRIYSTQQNEQCQVL